MRCGRGMFVDSMTDRLEWSQERADVQITPNRMQGTGGTLTSRLRAQGSGVARRNPAYARISIGGVVGSFRDIIVKRDSITNDGFVPIAYIF